MYTYTLMTRTDFFCSFFRSVLVVIRVRIMRGKRKETMSRIFCLSFFAFLFLLLHENKCFSIEIESLSIHVYSYFWSHMLIIIALIFIHQSFRFSFLLAFLIMSSLFFSSKNTGFVLFVSRPLSLSIDID